MNLVEGFAVGLNRLRLMLKSSNVKCGRMSIQEVLMYTKYTGDSTTILCRTTFFRSFHDD